MYLGNTAIWVAGGLNPQVQCLDLCLRLSEVSCYMRQMEGISGACPFKWIGGGRLLRMSLSMAITGQRVCACLCWGWYSNQACNMLALVSGDKNGQGSLSYVECLVRKCI